MKQDNLKARRDAEDIRKATAKRSSSMRAKLSAGEAKPAGAQTYTVQEGDTLSGIAKKFLGDASRWQEIFEANKDTIKDPNLIRVGQEIKLPAG